MVYFTAKTNLSLSQKSSDLYSVQVPARVCSSVVVSNANLLNYITHIF